MKEEPRTGPDLFKFFCVGFGKGGHVNFIGVGQDLGHKMPNWRQRTVLQFIPPWALRKVVGLLSSIN
jgi:hypothetical protein